LARKGKDVIMAAVSMGRYTAVTQMAALARTGDAATLQGLRRMPATRKEALYKHYRAVLWTGFTLVGASEENDATRKLEYALAVIHLQNFVRS